jgi:hypothetical protein
VGATSEAKVEELAHCHALCVEVADGEVLV